MSDIGNDNDNILDEDKMEMDPSVNSSMGTALSSLMDESFPSKLPSELIKKVVVDPPVSGMPNTRDKATNEGPIKKIKPAPKRVVYPGKSALQASSSSKKANVVKTDIDTHKASLSTTSSTVSTVPLSLSDAILNNRYSSGNQGPFCVHVQKVSNATAQLHPVSVGKVIHSIMKESVLEVKKLRLMFPEFLNAIRVTGDHPANSSSCPELATHEEIKMVSAYRNITLLNASDIVRGRLPSSPPYSGSLEDFPQTFKL
ncbi:nucleic-acid-binding protein from mobile element jockey, partial [Lasius niger]